MPDDNNLVPPAGHEGPISTTEDVLRLLRKRPNVLNNEDTLDNPELEQLLSSLSKGMENIPDGALGAQPSRPLTLEDLAASFAPPALGETPIVESARKAIVACAKCGSANPELTHFCGTCGHELGPSSAGNPGRDECGQLGAEIATSRREAIRSRNSGQVWKIACLGLLWTLLGLVVYQQRWQLPFLRSRVWNSPTMPTSPVSPATQPSTTPGDATPVPRQETSVVRRPSIPAKPPKTAPPTTVKRPLAAPTPLNSPSPQQVELPTFVELPDAGSAGANTSNEAEPAPAQSAEPPAQPAPTWVSPGVAQGALIFKVNPQYPPAARSARIQGSVVMHAIIGADGTIQQLEFIRGNPLLVNAAMEAVKKWRYRPYLVDDKPVEVETNITVNFRGE